MPNPQAINTKMSDLTPKRGIKKRKYSRNGCLECKRRKIKCDEDQPSCGHCSRIEHDCVYPDADAPKKPRKPRVSIRSKQFQFVSNDIYSKELKKMKQSYLHDVDEVSANSLPTVDSTNGNKPFNGLATPALEPVIAPPPGTDILQMPTEIDDFSFENMLDDANSLVHGLADFDILDLNLSARQPNSLKPFHSNIILNTPNNNNVFDENELESYLKDTSPTFSHPDLESVWNSIPIIDTPRQNFKHEQSNLELIEKIILIYKLSDPEIAYFKEITYTDLIFYIYPYGTSVEDDEIIRILLEYIRGFKYLLYAMIALSASCCFTKTNDPVHERNYKKYSTICMKLLVGAFGELKSNKNLLRNIEGLVLTVIILAMIFADVACMDFSNVSNSWTSHLNGARDLISKYNKAKFQLASKDSSESPGITIAKLLYFNYDWISKLNTSPEILNTYEFSNNSIFLDSSHFGYAENPQFHNALRKLGVLTPATATLSCFNLYLTLTEEVVYAIEELIVVTRKTKTGCTGTEYRQIEPMELMKVMRLIDEAAKQEIVPLIKTSPDMSIPLASPGHPDFPENGRKVYLPPAAYAEDYDDEGKKFYYSTCDVSQQLHVYFLYLKVLTTPGLLYLPRRHPMIKETVKKVLGLMYFIKLKTSPNYKPENVLLESEHYYLSKQLFDFKAMMNQLTFRICAELTDDLDDFERLELYFNGLLKLSNGSATFALDRLSVARERAIERNKKKKASGKLDTADLFDETDHVYSVESYPVY